MTRAMYRVLVVDDEPEIRNIIRVLLEAEGYRIAEAATASRAEIAARTEKPDLVLLDLGLPDGDGLAVLRSIRAWSPVPLVVLSARTMEEQKIVALDAGADDYVTKPFSPRELTARLQAAIRRSQKPGVAPVNLVTFGKVAADFSAMEFSRDGVPVALTANEVKLLKYFIDHAERVVTREELLNDVWGYTHYPTTRTVDNQVMKLRQKLEVDPARPVHFRTMHGIGYKFVTGS